MLAFLLPPPKATPFDPSPYAPAEVACRSLNPLYLPTTLYGHLWIRCQLLLTVEAKAISFPMSLCLGETRHLL